ncbi:MAG TPA: CRISPR-associated protein Csx11, partial [Pseudothermotoga sp.]
MSILETLSKNRTPILLAEIGAYLHDLGKATKEFVESKMKDRKARDQHANSSIFPDKIRDLLSKIEIDVLGERASILDFIHHHGDVQNIPALVRLICARSNGFDGIDSGVDKGKAKESQRSDYAFISNAFGFEYHKIEIDQIEDIKDKLYAEICDYLCSFLDGKINVETLRKEIFHTKEHYLKFLGETRRPANDVTLWDHSYSVATMTKCAIAQIFLNPNIERDPLYFNWKVFAVNFDVLGLLSKGIKVGDIKGYSGSIKRVFEEIKEEVEVIYPIGNEIYRDMSGIYFLIADEETSRLKEEIQRKIADMEPEIIIYITEIPLKTEPPSKSNKNEREDIEEKKKENLMKCIPESRKKALQQISFPVYSESFPHDKFTLRENEQTCPVCRLRTVGTDKGICNHCLKRRENRSQEWQKNPKYTIWLDEVSDHNDRVALIVGTFELNYWLDGSFIRTLTFSEPSETEDFRKYPSPARIRRVWETTERFIKEDVFGILERSLRKEDPRTKRIQLVISPNQSIPKNSTCDVIVNGARFSPVCIDDTRSIFISTTNLEILNKFGKTVEEIAKTLSGQDIKLKTEEEKNWKDFKIIEAKPANDEFQDYLPYIEIYDFPDQFMVLVPAYEALSITEKILMEYEKQFSKVRDRLPLHLGIIAFHRRTPLYIVMDAAKRLLKGFEMSKTIEAKVLDVEDIEDQELGKCRKLKLQTDGRDIPLSWIISHSTKDPGEEDLWYPYLRIPDKLQDRDLSFDYTGNGDYVVHVKEMKKG